MHKKIEHKPLTLKSLIDYLRPEVEKIEQQKEEESKNRIIKNKIIN